MQWLYKDYSMTTKVFIYGETNLHHDWLKHTIFGTFSDHVRAATYEKNAELQ